MKQPRNSCHSPKVAGLALALFGLGGLLGGPGEAQAQVATATIIDGVIDRITVDNMNDPWSGGVIEVGGQRVIIPKNLLMDLPANRMTLRDFMSAAPGVCGSSLPPQSGLARADSPSCNTSGQPGFALIHANRTSAGNVIAGDVFIQKGIEAVAGTVSYINYNDGYFRMNGNLNDPTTGVMVRINDPDSRHTIQSGLGCLAGQSNCSADPRFTLDADNYTNVFMTGFPLCIPSRTPRTFVDVLGLNTNSAQASLALDGSGDVLCPLTNRTVNNGNPVIDSRRFAPILVGDSMTAEGNFEKIGGVRFLSAHSTMVARALTTQNLPDQPDYMFLDEVEIDISGFQNQRARSLFIGFATLAPEDILIWSLHYDPTNNDAHELPLASVRGCNVAAGPGTCGAQGLVGIANIFKIRHDIDFLAGAKPRLNPCAHLIADPRMHSNGVVPCNGNASATNTVDMFGVLSPIPHEIQARTGHALANPGQKSIDINGNEATHGQYLFPFGLGLGGISFPEFVEINLDATATPLAFSGIPWNLDRRLGPGGCLRVGAPPNDVAQCDPTRQPLIPFPFEIIDPRLQASLPLGAFTDRTFTQTDLTRVADRIFSFVDATGRANGDTTVLDFNAVINPAALPITAVVDITTANLPPLITSTANLVARAAPAPTLYQYQVGATDDGGAANLTYSLGGTPPTGMTISPTGLITWTPQQNQAPAQGVTVTVTDSGSLSDKQAFVIAVNGSPTVLPVPHPATAKVNQVYTYQAFAQDPNVGQGRTFSLVSPLAGMNITANGFFSWTPTLVQVGPRSFNVRVTDADGAIGQRSFSVSVIP